MEFLESKKPLEKVQALKNIGVKVNFYSTNKKLFTLFDPFVAEFSYIIKALFTKQDFIIARFQLMFGTKLISIIKKYQYIMRFTQISLMKIK